MRLLPAVSSCISSSRPSISSIELMVGVNAMRKCAILIQATLSLLIITEAKAIDWCTETPLPSDWEEQVKQNKLFVNWKDAPLGPKNGWGNNFWPENRKPTIVWCMARDDQHPPRVGQCIGVGTTDKCLQGWLGREAWDNSEFWHNAAVFQAYNQHERDTRFMTLISDAPSGIRGIPAYPLPPLPPGPRE